jgi:proteasome lid subunit RPN8/RPN11
MELLTSIGCSDYDNWKAFPAEFVGSIDEKMLGVTTLLDKTRCGNEDVEIVVYKLASSEYSVL